MSTTTAIRCDVCQRQKAEVNHWFKVWLLRTSETFGCCAAEIYDAHYPNWYLHKDVCGLECATKLFQRFLDHGTLEP